MPSEFPRTSFSGSPVSENSLHRNVVRALLHSPGPLRIELPLHIGFPKMSSVTDWVSENTSHRKPSFREELFSETGQRWTRPTTMAAAAFVARRRGGHEGKRPTYPFSSRTTITGQ